MLIHVGLHKTGTTYLQHHVFPSAELGFRMVGDHKEIIERVVLANPYAYGPGRLRDVFGPRIEAAKKASLTPVISCERLSGSPAAGECLWADGTERLAEAFPEADIVLTIREQGSILASIYKHLIRNWLSASIREFLDQEPLSRCFLPICRLEYYEYHWMISHCMRLTGSADRVHVLPFEWLRESPTRFIQPIMVKRRLAEVQLPREVVNRGFCSLACSLQRRANRWCVPKHFIGRHGHPARLARALCWRCDRLLPERMARASDRRLAGQIKAIIGARFEASNAETARLTGIDLRELGYATQLS